MDWIIWVIVIVVIVGVVWWLLNRNSSGNTTGTATPSDSVASAPRVEETGASSPLSAGKTAAGGDVDDWDEESAAEPEPAAAAAKPEWEAQWSEAGSTPHAAQPHAAEAPAAQAGTHAPVHHPEYTEPHAPTLPGAESAAAEDVLEPATVAEERPAPATAPPTATATAPAGGSSAGGSSAATLSEGDAETLQAAASSAATEADASHTAEPAGHLAAEQPYGEGSAAPGPDGRGPEGYTVKGDAQSMTYHDETSPAYEETVAEVWFESAAHAEAAGFRAPRRSRR
jgi:hypothetical protein